MKTSTLMTAALLSASCFATPSHTASEDPSVRTGPIPTAALRSDLRDVPVAPPAPDVPATIDPGPDHWQHLTLPKSHHLDRSFIPELHEQT
ncbi:MAG TPA: hypothetical protein VL689_15100 [Paraburkholderia sp.]|jgi:hypothetical protein|nr:hypothetical protein [Paraburkholderia sp.]